MQFKVPQFLEIEDKIFGPFTFRQFVYLAGGGGMCFVFYRLLSLFWGFLPIAFVASLSLALAFYRPNDKPFIDALEAGIKYFAQNKLYIWKKGPPEIGTSPEIANLIKKKGSTLPQNESRISGGKLRDLAWSLDVLDLNKNRQ